MSRTWIVMEWMPPPEEIRRRTRVVHETAEENETGETKFRRLGFTQAHQQDGRHPLATTVARQIGRRYFKHRRPPIPDRLGIANRPQHIEKREEFGHWEGDLMQFRTQRGNLLTLCERKTRLSLTFPLPSKAAEPTAQAVADQITALPGLAYDLPFAMFSGYLDGGMTNGARNNLFYW